MTEDEIKKAALSSASQRTRDYLNAKKDLKMISEQAALPPQPEPPAVPCATPSLGAALVHAVVPATPAPTEVAPDSDVVMVEASPLPPPDNQLGLEETMEPESIICRSPTLVLGAHVNDDMEVEPTQVVEPLAPGSMPAEVEMLEGTVTEVATAAAPAPSPVPSPPVDPAPAESLPSAPAPVPTVASPPPAPEPMVIVSNPLPSPPAPLAESVAISAVPASPPAPPAPVPSPPAPEPAAPVSSSPSSGASSSGKSSSPCSAGSKSTRSGKPASSCSSSTTKPASFSSSHCAQPCTCSDGRPVPVATPAVPPTLTVPLLPNQPVVPSSSIAGLAGAHAGQAGGPMRFDQLPDDIRQMIAMGPRTLAAAPSAPAAEEPQERINTSTHRTEAMRLNRFMQSPAAAEFPHMSTLFNGSNEVPCMA